MIDSVDWLEPLIWQKACQENGWKDLEQPGYGKGYVAALDLWRRYLDRLNTLRDDRDMAIIQIAHTDIKRFDSPEHEPYDRYVIKLHARAAALLQEHSDVVLFANYRISTVKSDVGFNKKVTRALGSGERVLYTAERPAFLAKNDTTCRTVCPCRGPRSPRRCLTSAIHRNKRINPVANLGTTFDATTVEPNKPLEPLPPGQYRGSVNSEMRPTKDGRGQHLWVEIDILDGPYAGRKLFDRLNLINTNPTTVEIAQRDAVCDLPRRGQDAGRR